MLVPLELLCQMQCPCGIPGPCHDDLRIDGYDVIHVVRVTDVGVTRCDAAGIGTHDNPVIVLDGDTRRGGYPIGLVTHYE